MSHPLHDQLTELFARALHVDVPTPDIDLFETGVLDSLAFVELLLQLEQQFGVTTSVDDLEIDNFRSIARIAAFVTARSAGAPDEASQRPGVQFTIRG
jgi:methoxymalonate biosynthesis acyl carrier protein